MQLVIDPADGLPIYRQIMRQIMEAVAGGRLKAGKKLPSHRDLSEQIVVAPLTVKKAYDELEALGFIEMHRGRGTFVCAVLPKVDRCDQLELLRQDARRLLSQAYLAGMKFSEIIALLKSADRELAGVAQEKKERS